MNTNKELVKIAIEARAGRGFGNYSAGDSMEVLRNAMIEANGGSTKIDYRSIRDGKCRGLFSLVEEIINKVVVDGLPDSCPLFQFADFRNVKAGDQQVFEIRDGGVFVVADIAHGTQGLRRQRLAGGEEIVVKTQLKGIKIYEEMRRVLAGRADLNDLIDKVSEAFTKALNSDIYDATKTAFAGLKTPYLESGTFAESKLASLVDHVEAATGQKAKIICSKQAARLITGVKGADAESAKDELFNMGYYGHFYGTPIIVMDNAHKPGTNEFILGTDLYIVASDDKFAKVVLEGDTLMLPSESVANADLSQEYLMTMEWGCKVVFSETAGYYALAAA